MELEDGPVYRRDLNRRNCVREELGPPAPHEVTRAELMAAIDSSHDYISAAVIGTNMTNADSGDAWR